MTTISKEVYETIKAKADAFDSNYSPEALAKLEQMEKAMVLLIDMTHFLMRVLEHEERINQGMPEWLRMNPEWMDEAKALLARKLV